MDPAPRVIPLKSSMRDKALTSPLSIRRPWFKPYTSLFLPEDSAPVPPRGSSRLQYPAPLRVAPEKCRWFQGLQVLGVVGGRVHWTGPLFPPRRLWGSSPLAETRNTSRMLEFRSQLRAEYHRYFATLADPSIGSSSVPQRRLLAFPRTTTPTRLQPTEYTAPTPLPSKSR